MRLKRAALTWGIPAVLVVVAVTVALSIDLSPPPEGADAWCHPEAIFAGRAQVADLFASEALREFDKKIRAIPFFSMLTANANTRPSADANEFVKIRMGIDPARDTSWNGQAMKKDERAPPTCPDCEGILVLHPT